MPGILRLVLVCGLAALPSARAQPASLSVGGGAHVQVPASADFANQQFSIALWLRPTGPGANGGGTLVSCGQQPGMGTFLTSWWTGWNAATGHILGMAVHQFATSGTVITSNASVPLGQWAHAAFTFDGVTLRLYLNGALDREAPYGFTGVDFPANPAVNIGAFILGPTYTYTYFDGQLDDVSIWSRALTAPEVSGLAGGDSTAGLGGLVLHIPFTDHSLQDVSGNGHNAAAMGAVGFDVQAPGLNGPAITAQPQPVIACPAGAARFTAAATGASAFRWQMETTPNTWIDAMDGALPYNGGTIIASGSAGPVLMLSLNILPGAPSVQFRCVASNACGAAVTDPAMLSTRPGGYANCDKSTSPPVFNVLDFVCFLNKFAAGCT